MTRWRLNVIGHQVNVFSSGNPELGEVQVGVLWLSDDDIKDLAERLSGDRSA